MSTKAEISKCLVLTSSTSSVAAYMVNVSVLILIPCKGKL